MSQNEKGGKDKRKEEKEKKGNVSKTIILSRAIIFMDKPFIFISGIDCSVVGHYVSLKD